MFHSGFSNSNTTSVHSWVESVESVLLVSYGHDLERVSFARLRLALSVNMDDSAKRFLAGLTPANWAEFKGLFVECFGQTV